MRPKFRGDGETISPWKHDVQDDGIDRVGGDHFQRGFAIQAVYVVVFLAAAWANFATRDITT